MAAQEFVFVAPDDTADSLWRRKLFPLGLRLFRRVLADLEDKTIVAVPQDEGLATWEPSWERPPLRRPDLLMIGGGALEGFRVIRDAAGAVQRPGATCADPLHGA